MDVDIVLSVPLFFFVKRWGVALVVVVPVLSFPPRHIASVAVVSVTVAVTAVAATVAMAMAVAVAVSCGISAQIRPSSGLACLESMEVGKWTCRSLLWKFHWEAF